jgi:hypothetical protein
MCRSRTLRLVPVVFGFEKIESYSDIPAFDIAILVERQLRKARTHGNSPLTGILPIRK